MKPDEIIRSARKTIAIQIDAFGRVIVRAPKRCAEERIFSFLEEKRDWIERKVSKMQGAGVRLPSEDLDGYNLLLLGKSYRIRLEESARIRIEEGVLHLPKKNAKVRLVAWLKENAKRIFTQCTKEYAQKMGVQPTSVRISSARSKWGCCTGDNRISYSFRLIYTPKEVVEYVVVHELAHILHKDHSKAFWKEVERVFPDWKERRKWLKDHTALMHVF